jgi:8-hydroxy-5-deazaflavin:NADPH oxidoreductase
VGATETPGDRGLTLPFCGLRRTRSIPGLRYTATLQGGETTSSELLAQHLSGAGLIDEVGFAPAGMGSLHEGGARQQPGSPIYNNPMTAEEAESAVTSLR